MPSEEKTVSQLDLRKLPSVDELLRSETARKVAADVGEDRTIAIIRLVLDTIRQSITSHNLKADTKEGFFELARTRLNDVWRSERLTSITRVINATGVVIHTNLGRAPYSETALNNITNAAGYCTIEYNIEEGKRGKRGLRAENVLAELTGAGSALVVNNCAAAAFFVLTVFASGGEVIVSRGELVEIGGDFRVPDVLSQSGAKLREVGTTNRTKLADYENAVNENTKLILRVHPSNYRIIGFTAMPSLPEMADLAHRKNILLYEDIGSGALIDLADLGLGEEPVVKSSIAAGADLVTFSGDKLLGGPQAGIIAGKKELVDRLRIHPLYRALRVDKLTLSALEATLDSYRRNRAMDEIPVLRMLSQTKAELTRRAERFSKQLNVCSDLSIELIDGDSAIGGGAAPMVKLETKLVSIINKKLSVSKFEKTLRNSSTPIITRIVDNRIIIDLRTVSEKEEAELVELIIRSFGQNPA